MHLRLSSRYLAATLGLAAVSAFAQETASVIGKVTDATGAVVPNVSVTLVNPKTNVRYTATTNNEGLYRFANVAPGPGYVESFTAPGFAVITVTDVYANVGTARTQNAVLRAGSSTEVQVSATSSRVTVNTVDATVGNTLDISAVYDLPIQVRGNLNALLTLQPGVTNASLTPGGATASVTGARTDQNSITVDGLDVNDIAAGASLGQVGGAPADAIQEFKGTVAGLLPISGTGGGGQYQFVTKSGTNSFHGNINEYHRDVSTVANDWFNNNAGVRRPNLIRNQFGGNIGGPVWRDRLFFFFNYYGQKITQSTAVNQVVPLDSYRNGNVSYILARDASGNACTAASRQNTTPQCIGTLNSAQIRALDPQGVGFNANVLSLFNSRYPHANDLTRGDGVNYGGYRFTTPTPSTTNNYWGRIDFNLSASHRLFVRGGWNRVDQTQTAIQFPGDPITHPYTDRSYSYVIGHTWTIGSNKINQFEYGDNVQINNFATTYNPTGTTYFSQLGSPLVSMSNPYASPSSQRRRIPIPIVRDDFNWTVGNHNFSFGGTFKFIKTNSQLVGDFNYYGLGIGGNTSQLTSALRPANIRGGSTAPNDFDSAFALALGRVSSVTSNYNFNNQGTQLAQGTGAVRNYRYYQTELYFGDQWRVNPKFTLDYGVRYQLYSVPFETRGNQSVQNTSFDQYFGARLAQSKAGISGDTAVPFITYQLGGKANSGPNVYSPNYKDFAPRLGFAYSPQTDTVFHGSASVVFDRTVINAVNFIQDQSSYLFQNTTVRNYGVSTSAKTSLLNDPRLGANLAVPAPPVAPAISKPYTPYVANGSPYGLAANTFNTIVDPNLKDPYNIVYTAGFQHDVRGGFILKMDYVGRLGRRLLAAADASQLVDFADSRSGQGLGTAFANLSTQVRNGRTVTPQAWFENVLPAGFGVSQGYNSNTAFLADSYGSLITVGDFADFIQALASGGLLPSNVGMASQFSENSYETNKGSSNYHGLLLTLTKNLSNGIRFDFNYTWSHSIDNTSAVANFIPASSGFGFLCDAQNLRTCRASSDFDVRHVMNANFIYNLPFGRGRSFGGNIPWLLDEAIGGWQISGIPQWRSGLPFSAQTGAYVAGYANNAPAIFGGNYGAISGKAQKRSTGQVNLFSDPVAAAAAFQGPIGFQIGQRNFLRGPSAWQFDAGLAKTFRIVPNDRLNLKFRADAFNVLNHPVFANPNTNISSGNFGQITSVAVAPRVAQFALRLEF